LNSKHIEVERQLATVGPGFNLLGMLGPNGRIATGDPAHVPIGIYAERASKKLGLRDAVSLRIARTDNVRSALLVVERGEAPVGMVYAGREPAMLSVSATSVA
jgi:molybdate transport system substrate-binding protein